MSKSQQRRLKIQMKLSERIRVPYHKMILGDNYTPDGLADEVAQLEAKLEAITCAECETNLLVCRCDALKEKP